MTGFARALFAHLRNKGVFYRQGETVVKAERMNGKTRFRTLTTAHAASAFDAYASFLVQGRTTNVPVPHQVVLPEGTAKALLACSEKSLLHEVLGLIPFPLLANHNGTLVEPRTGYNETLKVYVDSDQPVPVVPLDEAVMRILSLVEDFDFQTESDKSRAIASFITPALKFGRFIDGNAPVDVAEADRSQSGKTYRQQLIPAIYNSGISLITNQRGGVGSLDESLANAMNSGKPFIQIDNVRGKLNSERLEAIATASEPFDVRIPHAGYVSVDPKQFLLYITSNDFKPTPDLANRSSIIRIRKRPPEYAFQNFEEGDLLAHVRANYMHYLSAIYAVVRHWFQQGCPRTNEGRHDMREWCQVCDWIVQNTFGLPPLMDGHTEAKARSTNPYLGFVRTLSLAAQQRNRLNVELTATQLGDMCAEAGLVVPDLAVEHQENSDHRKRKIGSIFKTIFPAEDGSIQIEGFIVTKSARREQTMVGYGQTLHCYTFAVAGGVEGR